jgi:hypothetical protein
VQEGVAGIGGKWVSGLVGKVSEDMGIMGKMGGMHAPSLAISHNF